MLKPRSLCCVICAKLFNLIDLPRRLVRTHKRVQTGHINVSGGLCHLESVVYVWLTAHQQRFYPFPPTLPCHKRKNYTSLRVLWKCLGDCFQFTCELASNARDSRSFKTMVEYALGLATIIEEVPLDIANAGHLETWKLTPRISLLLL